jgi:hypothetical protein
MFRKLTSNIVQNLLVQVITNLIQKDERFKIPANQISQAVQTYLSWKESEERASLLLKTKHLEEELAKFKIALAPEDSRQIETILSMVDF